MNNTVPPSLPSSQKPAHRVSHNAKQQHGVAEEALFGCVAELTSLQASIWPISEKRTGREARELDRIAPSVFDVQ